MTSSLIHRWRTAVASTRNLAASPLLNGEQRRTTIKALLLIDPVIRTITEVAYDGDSRKIALLLSDTRHGIKCSTFTAIYLVDGLTIFVDDDGLLNEPKYFFRYEGYARPIAGRGLVLGVTRKGDSVGTLTIDDLMRKVTFHRLGVAGACRCRGTRHDCNAAP